MTGMERVSLAMAGYNEPSEDKPYLVLIRLLAQYPLKKYEYVIVKRLPGIDNYPINSHTRGVNHIYVDPVKMSMKELREKIVKFATTNSQQHSGTKLPYSGVSSGQSKHSGTKRNIVLNR